MKHNLTLFKWVHISSMFCFSVCSGS